MKINPKRLGLILWLLLLHTSASAFRFSNAYSTWKIENDSIFVDYYWNPSSQSIFSSSLYVDQPDSALLAKFYEDARFYSIIQTTYETGKKYLPKFIDCNSYSTSHLIKSNEFHNLSLQYTWIHFQLSFSAYDSMFYQNGKFADTSVFNLVCLNTPMPEYTNLDLIECGLSNRVFIYLNNLIETGNLNNKSTIFPSQFNHSSVNAFLKATGTNPIFDALYFSPGAVETDGDSISFELSPTTFHADYGSGNKLFICNDSWDYPHTYYNPITTFCPNPSVLKCNPFPTTYPPFGFYQNKKTGEIITRMKYLPYKFPTTYKFGRQLAPIKQIVREFRNDKIGNPLCIGHCDYYTMVAFSFEYQNDNNLVPRIESPQFEYYTCPDDSLIIPISTTKSKWIYSSLAYDTNFIWWDTALATKGAQFNIVDPKARDKKANFIWKTDSSHLRDQPYRFTVFTNSDTILKNKNLNISPQWNSRTFLVYVRPKPRIFYHAQQLACGRLQANVDSFIDMAGKWNFAWQLLDSTGKLVSNYNEKSIDLVVPNSGKWFLKIIATNDYAGCPFIAQDSFIVAPFMQFNLSDTSYICTAQPLLVAANASKGPSPYSYFWQSSTDTSHADVFLFDGRKDSTLKLTIKDANGCLATDSIAPKIKVSPVFDLGFEGLALCQGDTLTLVVPDKVKHLPFVWQPNNLKTEAVHITAPQVVTLNVTDTFNQCTFGDTMTVSFFASPKASFQYSTVCDPSLNFTFNGNLPEGESAYTFNWQLPDTQFTSKDFSYAFKSFGEVPVKLQIQSQIGCFDTITQLVATGMQVKAQFTANDVCNGDTVVFNNTTQRHALNNQMNFYWRFGNGAFDTLEQPKYLYPFSNNAKTFLVTLVANSPYCTDSTTLPVTILALPDADFSALFMNKTATLSALTIDNNFTYNWDLGDGKIASTPVVNHTYDANLDTVTICLTVNSQENCSSTICKRLKTTGLFNPTLDQNGYKVYPNPNNGTFKLECPKTDNYQVELFDTKGQLIERYTFKNKQYDITLPQNSKGVYLLKIKGEHSGGQQVLVVVH